MPERQIITLDVERAIADVALLKQQHMQQFLYFVDLYGLTEVATWVRNVEADLNGSRMAVGTIGDPRR